MDKLAFEKAMTSQIDYDEQYIKNIIRQSIDANSDSNHPRGTHNLIIVTEELAELAQQITKQIRGKGDYTHILEELADNYLGIMYVQEILGINDDTLRKACMVKTKRVDDKLKDTGSYK
jgi:NTP pyrophosphatase (non-canonical NTP hydrolase)